jgi:hypothetical protein
MVVDASSGYRELSWEDDANVEPLDVSFVAANGQALTVSCEGLRAIELRRARPVRAPRSYRGQTHFCGEYWSATTQTMLAWESRQELVQLMRLDQGPRWCHLLTQPLRVRFVTDGKVHSHVPDILALDSEGSVHVVDVKMTDHLKDPLVRAAFSATKEAVGRSGWSYAVASEMPAPLVENLRWLAGFRRPFLADPVIAAGLVESCVKPRPIKTALAGSRREPEARPVLMHLLWTGQLCCALDKVLSDETVVVAGGPQ